MDPLEARSPQDYAALIESIDIPQRSRGGAFEVILGLVEDVPRGRALDAPCGPGRLSEALRRVGFEVTAADLDAEAFALHGQVPFFEIDLDAALPFEAGEFGLVVCGDGIEHLENPFALFRELSRILAAKGTLVVATPNYLNLERRLKFLWSGSLTRPLPRERAASDAARKQDRGHINPLTLIRMAHMAEAAGLELVRCETVLPKRRQYWLAPLALLIRCFRPFLKPERERDLYADHTFTLGALLGGKKLIAVFRKAG